MLSTMKESDLVFCNEVGSKEVQDFGVVGKCDRGVGVTEESSAVSFRSPRTQGSQTHVAAETYCSPGRTGCTVWLTQPEKLPPTLATNTSGGTETEAETGVVLSLRY